MLRWFVLAYYASNLALLSISQLIHAFSFGLTHVASVYFLSQYFSAQFQSRAQALYVSIAFGIGGALGSVIAGHMWDSGSGAKLSFSFSALMAFVGLLLLIIAIITRMDKRFINRQKV